MRLSKKCANCGKEFFKKTNNSLKIWNTRVKYCSRECSKITHFPKGHITWNKNKKNWLPQEIMIKANIKRSGKKNHNWKGDDAGSRAIHLWIERQKGKAKDGKCVDCGVTGEMARLEWSNKDHAYRREVNDYEIRCKNCHSKYDIENNGYRQ